MILRLVTQRALTGNATVCAQIGTA